MNTILEFIKTFQSPSNIELFSECACYWFAVILQSRFKGATIMYDSTRVHFATNINGILYDITGVIEDTSDYTDWDDYSSRAYDTDIIERYCIYLERR